MRSSLKESGSDARESRPGGHRRGVSERKHVDEWWEAGTDSGELGRNIPDDFRLSFDLLRFLSTHPVILNMRRPVVIVTGASRFDYPNLLRKHSHSQPRSCRGIGLATTKTLLTEFNAIVGAISRSKPPELVQLEQAHGESLKIFQCDMFVDPLDPQETS